MSDPAGLVFDPCTQEQFDALTAVFGSADNAAVVCQTMRSFKYDDTSLRYGVNSAWLINTGALVFVMHGGFAMLCAGSIRSKNAMNILLQTILDACVSAIGFYVVGFAFAYGEGNNPNGFIGDAMFALSRYRSHYTGTGEGYWTDFFFQWAFATTATTIPAGAVAERFNFNAYLGYTIFLSCFVYPVVAHWVWCRQGWLTYAAIPPMGRTKHLFGSGMIDFAGSGVVHMVGGLSGLMGAWLVGPRIGRFDQNGNPIPLPGHSAILVVLGTVLLWFGWYGFNPGSTLIIDNVTSATVAARAAVCTTLSGAAAGLMALATGFLKSKAWDLVGLCNGVLVGFVSITAGAHVLEPWAAILAGAIGSLVFDGACWLLLKLKIDDPLSASPMHGFCGAWAVFWVGLLAKEEYVQEAYGRSEYYGGFYKGGGGKLLASQCIGIIVIAAWVMVNMGALFALFKFLGILRVPAEEEHQGLDASAHGGAAYNDHAAAAGAGDQVMRNSASKIKGSTVAPLEEGQY